MGLTVQTVTQKFLNMKNYKDKISTNIKMQSIIKKRNWLVATVNRIASIIEKERNMDNNKKGKKKNSLLGDINVPGSSQWCHSSASNA